MIQRWAKPSGVADYVGADKRVVYGWMRRGLPFSRLPSGRVLIDLRRVDEFLESFQGGLKEDRLDAVVEDVFSKITGTKGRAL